MDIAIAAIFDEIYDVNLFYKLICESKMTFLPTDFTSLSFYSKPKMSCLTITIKP